MRTAAKLIFAYFSTCLIALVFYFHWSSENVFGYKKLIIHTYSGDHACKIPLFDPWDKSVVDKINFIKSPLNCHHNQPELSFLTKDRKLKINSTLMVNYNSLNCSYRCVIRGKDDYKIYYDDPVIINLTMPNTTVDCDFPEVRCTEGGNQIYVNVHSQIFQNLTRLQELNSILPVEQHRKHHNVIMLIFDSVSRLNFLRLCPKSAEVLKSLYNATFFEGMTRVADNSHKNALAFFAGKYYGNYSDDTIFKEYYDNFDFIWKRYAKNGYLTLDVQDSTKSNIFLYLKKGFLHQPTDHRQRVFWLASNRLPGGSHYSKPCYGNHAKHNLMLKYLEDFMTNYDHDHPKFVMFWNIGLCHDYIERLAYADDDFAQFLSRNYDLLKESFMFVMSDHGHKFSSIRNTVIGHFEANMPLFALSLPKSLTEKFPELTEIVNKNAKVLVNHYDTYVTLRDILESQLHGWNSLSEQRDWSFTHVDVHNVQSLLRPIKTGRTCEDVGIPAEYCICDHYIPVSLNDNRVPNLGSSVIAGLNSHIASDVRCAKLTLDKVVTVTQLSHLDNELDPKIKQRFIVTVLAKPSGGTFEAHVRFDDKRYFVDGRILRTNRYGNQSKCVFETNPSIKEYCYCI